MQQVDAHPDVLRVVSRHRSFIPQVSSPVTVSTALLGASNCRRGRAYRYYQQQLLNAGMATSF